MKKKDCFKNKKEVFYKKSFFDVKEDINLED